MDRDNYRWAWFALALLIVLGWGFANRHAYRDCHPSGCIVTNRWTGSVRWVSTNREVSARDTTDPVAAYRRTYGATR